MRGQKKKKKEERKLLTQFNLCGIFKTREHEFSRKEKERKYNEML